MQIWLGLTGRTRMLHRGQACVRQGSSSAAGAYYLALTINPKYAAYAAGLFMLATAWLITTGMAVLRSVVARMSSTANG